VSRRGKHKQHCSSCGSKHACSLEAREAPPTIAGAAGGCVLLFCLCSFCRRSQRLKTSRRARWWLSTSCLRTFTAHLEIRCSPDAKCAELAIWWTRHPTSPAYDALWLTWYACSHSVPRFPPLPPSSGRPSNPPPCPFTTTRGSLLLRVQCHNATMQQRNNA
jgi:hypothetical protein